MERALIEIFNLRMVIILRAQDEQPIWEGDACDLLLSQLKRMQSPARRTAECNALPPKVQRRSGGRLLLSLPKYMAEPSSAGPSE